MKLREGKNDKYNVLSQYIFMGYHQLLVDTILNVSKDTEFGLKVQYS